MKGKSEEELIIKRNLQLITFFGLVQTFWFAFFQQVIPGVIINNKYTLGGLIATASIVIISIVTSLLKVYYDDKVYRDDISILEAIYKGLNASFSLKAENIYEHIRNHSNGLNHHLLEITQPNRQINSLLCELAKAISSIVGSDEGNVNSCLFFKLDGDEHWRQDCYDFNIESLDNLLKHNNSPVHFLLNNEAEFLFYSDKLDAVQEGNYEFNPKDNLNNHTGSIICKKLSVNLENGKVIIEAMLYISSYGKQLCSKKDEPNSKRILLETIIQPFIERLQMELSVLYLKELDNNQNSTILQ